MFYTDTIISRQPRFVKLNREIFQLSAFFTTALFLFARIFYVNLHLKICTELVDVGDAIARKMSAQINDANIPAGVPRST